MPTPLQRLRAGHHNVDRLLNVLTRQLHAFERGRTPDMALMRDILDGLNRYTGAGESACEARVIDELARADERFAPARVVLATEHAAIAELGERCLVLVEEIIDGALLPRSALTTPARRYVRRLRTHLSRERGYVHRLRRQSDAASVEQRRAATPCESFTEEFNDLGDRVVQAALIRQIDEAGEPICPACAIDAVSTADVGAGHR